MLFTTCFERVLPLGDLKTKIMPFRTVVVNPQGKTPCAEWFSETNPFKFQH